MIFSQLLGVIALGIFAVWGYDPSTQTKRVADEVPAELQGVGLKDKLGTQLDMSLEFTNDKGELVTLGQVMSDGRPAILSMVYFDCPSLCNYHLNGLNNTYKKMKWTAGKEFKVIAVSFNHRETSDLAHLKKQNYLKNFGREGVESGWHFLTGSAENINKLSDQLGFQFKWLEAQKEYSHPSLAYVLTPGGTISRYLQGIEFSPRTLRLSLLEAAQGTIGTVIDQVILFCFRFDPTKNKYTIYAFNIMRAGAGLTVLLLAIILGPLWLREKRNKV